MENRKYWAYMKKSIIGPYAPKHIAQLPGFNAQTLVCPEKSLGQWRECAKEDDFSIYLELSAISNQDEKNAVKKAFNENEVFKKVMEESLLRNKAFEKQISEIKTNQENAKAEFEKELQEKDAQIKKLSEELSNLKENQNAKPANPSWERLYEQLKKASETKIEKLKGEKNTYIYEIESLKNRIQSTLNAYEAAKNKLKENFLADKNALLEENIRFRNNLDEKDSVISSLNENIKTLIAKNNELQKIIFEEKKEKSELEGKRIEETASLKTSLSFEKAQNEKIKEELEDLREKFESISMSTAQKDEEQQELFKVIHSKIKLLNAYFQGLENKLKKAEQ